MLVLVVEDDAAIRRVLVDLLTEEGHEVVAAGDGLAALAATERGRPDLILLDLWLPALDGAGFVQRYRAAPPPHAPIILMTAGGQAAGRAAELGVDAYVGKPFDVEDLLALVEGFAPGPLS